VSPRRDESQKGHQQWSRGRRTFLTSPPPFCFRFFYSSDPEVGPALQKFMAKVQGGGGGMPGGFGGAPGGFGGGPGGFGGGADDDGGEIPDLDDLPDLE
jgi:hypothetical protein